MGETSFKTIQLPQSVIKQVDQAVKESEGFFSSRAELIKQATMRYIEELRKKNMILHAQFPTQNPSSDPLVTSGVTMGRKFNPIATSNAPCLSITQDYKFHIKSDKWELVGTISEIFTVTLIKDKDKIKKVTAQKVIKINLKRFEVISKCINKYAQRLGYSIPNDSVLVEQALVLTGVYCCERLPDLGGKTRAEFIMDAMGKNLHEGTLEFLGRFNGFRENGTLPCPKCHLKETKQDTSGAKTLIKGS